MLNWEKLHLYNKTTFKILKKELIIFLKNFM